MIESLLMDTYLIPFHLSSKFLTSIDQRTFQFATRGQCKKEKIIVIHWHCLPCSGIHTDIHISFSTVGG